MTERTAHVAAAAAVADRQIPARVRPKNKGGTSTPGKSILFGSLWTKGLKRMNPLMVDIRRNPYDGIGKPKSLKGCLPGLWSKRIQRAPQYVVEKSGVMMISCRGHCDDYRGFPTPDNEQGLFSS